MNDLITLFTQPGTYVSLAALTFMEIVLGVDNIIFIAIITGRLPKQQQKKARSLGLTLAIVFRVLLLLGIAHLARLTQPLFSVFGHGFAARDLVLLFGGLFLVGKSTLEIHERLQTHEHHGPEGQGRRLSFTRVVAEIIMLDVIFSLDSVITAVGLVREVPLMVIAILLSLVVMLTFSAYISEFINRYPTVKMLALSFLLMIGMLLFAEGFHISVPKGYAYFAMAFSLFVELLNLKVRGQAGAHQRSG